MDKPCFKCRAYDKGRDKCGILLNLQALHLDKLDTGQEHEETLTSRTSHIDDLLFRRPCRFSLSIWHWARYFVNQRGLKSQDEPDIHNDVVASLLKLDFLQIQPTYDDFRRYVTAITRSAVHREYAQIYGSHCCGTCVSFLEGSKRCGCIDLKPVPPQQYIHVNYSTKPKDVIHNSMLFLGQDDILNWASLCSRLSKEGTKASLCSGTRIWGLLSPEIQTAILKVAQTSEMRETFKFRLVEALNDLLKRQDFYQEKYFRDIHLASEARELLEQRQSSLSHREMPRLNRLLLEASYPQEIAQSHKGCPYYSSKQFVDVSNLDSLVTLSKNEVEDTLKDMESLGPRQRKLAKLLRLVLQGYKIEEIAMLMGKHRTTIPKELHGTSEREKSEKGEEIIYHQTGAFEIFRAIYTGAIFALERKEKHLWSVVHRRDFSSDSVQPGFSKISRELDISKRVAVEHYIEGWHWIKAQSTKGDGIVSTFEDDKRVKRPRQIVKVSEMRHPDFHMLLSFAEDDLEQDVRQHLARHILMCDSCSAQLEHIGIEIITEIERPIRIAERGRWSAARVAGRIHKASDSDGNKERVGASVGVFGALKLSRLPASLSYGLAVAVIGLLLILVLRETRYRRLDERLNSLERQNESLQQEKAVLSEQSAKSTAVAEQATTKQRALEQAIARLEHEDNVPRTPPAQRISKTQHAVTVQDTLGVATVGSEVILSRPGETNPTLKLSQALSQTVRKFVTTGSVTPTQLARNASTTIRDEIKRGESRGAGTAENLRALPISPILTAVRTTSPTLRWLPVPQAQSYEVVVVRYTKSGENEKERWSMNVGTETELTLKAGTLVPGGIYLWEVITKVSEREDVTVSPPAGFWVLDEKALHDVEAEEQDYSSSALVLSSLYAKYGLYEEALPQVKRLKVLNPTSRFVEKMLRRLRRQSGKQ